jgi:type IV secretory pathway VirD2 relaxase
MRNPDKNRGSDILLIGLLNANMPSKYRPQFAMSEDSAKDLIIEWRKAAKDVERVARPTKDGNGAELPTSVEQTLAEILEKRRSAPKEREEQEGG